jgi:hypothetical protein
MEQACYCRLRDALLGKPAYEAVAKVSHGD